MGRHCSPTVDSLVRFDLAPTIAVRKRSADLWGAAPPRAHENRKHRSHACMLVGALGFALLALALAGCGAPTANPQIQSFSPATIVPGRTTLLVISGQGFRDGALVTLGGRVHAARSVWVNAGYMTAVLPADISPADYSVDVTNPDGQRVSTKNRVTVAAGLTPTPTPTPEPKATIYPATPTATASPTSTPTPTPTPTPTAAPTPLQSPPRLLTPTPQPPAIIPPTSPPQPGDRPRPSEPFRRSSP